MSWKLVLPPQVENEIRAVADWYDSQRSGLGQTFQTDIFRVLRSIEANPQLNSRRHSRQNIRWRVAKHFPYRVVYEMHENERRVVVATVLHASRSDRHWRRRYQGD